MSLNLDFSLRLEDRGAARVLVSALLVPRQGIARLDGVALQVLDKAGDPLGVRMLLPIAGELHHPMLSTVELRCSDLPAGARVVGTAWCGAESQEAALPTEPFTELREHVRFHRRITGLADAADLDVLDGAPRRRLAALYPWVDEPRVPRFAAELDAVDSEDDAGIDELVDGLGLDAESADFLKDLLSEE